MPVLDPKQNFIKAYTLSHGLDLTLKTDGQYEGECPGCDKPVFRVDPATGVYNCRSCKVSGNLYTFIRWIHELGTKAHQSNGRTYAQKLQEFASNRSLLSPETLKHWGVFLHPVTHKWAIPGYDARGEIMNVYTFDVPKPGDKPRLMSTAGCEHQLFGMHLFDRRKGNVWVCESVWDAMVLWEVIQHTKSTAKGYHYTQDRNLSMEPSTNVVAVPGSNVFKDHWCEILNHKRVTLLYHSDHPKELSNGQLYIAGHWGLRNCVKMMAVNDCTTESVHYLHWGEQGYDPDRKSGYDVRDYLSGEED